LKIGERAGGIGSAFCLNRHLSKKVKAAHLAEEMSMPPSKGSRPWVFFALTYGVSWFFWIPATLVGQGVSTSPVALLLYLGGLGPPLAGIILTYLTRGKEGRRDYWQRVIEFRRISVGWYAVILLSIPVLTFLAILLDLLTGGSGAQFETVARFLAQPWTILPFAAFMLIFGPLPEELGWRGYVLDHLQAKGSALASSLVLGTAWPLWHLPMFFIEGTYQNGLGFGTLPFWLYMIAMIPESILMTWIYNNNRRSTLSAVLFHFTINFTGELFAVTERAEFYQVLLLVVAAIAVTIVWGPKTLTRRQTSLDSAKKTALT
jgi:membrane protease YdiL (CAAX protease family)